MPNGFLVIRLLKSALGTAKSVATVVDAGVVLGWTEVGVSDVSLLFSDEGAELLTSC